MKQLLLIIAVGMTTAYSLPGKQQSGFITGVIQPPEAVLNVQAIIGKDTFAGSMTNNAFEIAKLKSGTYKLLVVPNPPYTNFIKENIKVTDGQVTNIGEVKLKK